MKSNENVPRGNSAGDPITILNELQDDYNLLVTIGSYGPAKDTKLKSYQAQVQPAPPPQVQLAS